MQTKLVEQTTDKLVLKVKGSFSLMFVFVCFMGVPVSLIGGLGILGSIKELLSNFSFFLTYIPVLIVSLAMFILGIFLVFGAISHFLLDTICTFDRSLRKLIIKNPKFLPTQFYPYEYSFNEIANIRTVLSTVNQSETNSYEVYTLSVLLTSNKAIVISEEKKSSINQEKQAEIVNLIQNYLS